MIKIICAIVVAIASIFTLIPNVSTTSAKSYEGVVPSNVLLSALDYYYLTNSTTSTTLFYSPNYNDGQLYNVFGVSDNGNTFTADFGASLDISYNTRWTFESNNTYIGGYERPSQVYTAFSNPGEDFQYSNEYHMFIKFNSYQWSGSVTIQLPLFVWTDNVNNDSYNSTPITIPAECYGAFRGYYRNGDALMSLSFTRVVIGDYIYFSADIPLGTNVTSISYYYNFNFNSNLLTSNNRGMLRYLFTNMYFGNDGLYEYNLGYAAGYQTGTNTVNPNTNNYQAGYTAGVNYQKNNVDTSSASYQAGYTAGSNGANSLNNLFSGVLQAPVDVVLTALNFEIFGVNVSTFILSLLTIGFIVIILKLLL